MKDSKQGIDYEGAWDAYARDWNLLHPELGHIGDEWIGKGAGAAHSLAEYNAFIERRLIQPYINSEDIVLEIGVGGGKTSALLLNHCQQLICADISSNMLDATRERLGSDSPTETPKRDSPTETPKSDSPTETLRDRVSYVKLDGLTLSGIPEAAVDVCFCYDTMVHIEPRDIFNYLVEIPRVMRGKRLCLFHHANILSDLGWQKFGSEWQDNLRGQRHGCAFSVMTDNIMEKFLTHLDYKVILKDTNSVPRDCIWVCEAPAG